MLFPGNVSVTEFGIFPGLIIFFQTSEMRLRQLADHFTDIFCQTGSADMINSDLFEFMFSDIFFPFT